jgi:hypothetical protein
MPKKSAPTVEDFAAFMASLKPFERDGTAGSAIDDALLKQFPLPRQGACGPPVPAGVH